MRQTVLGVFDSYENARSTQRTLGEAGVAQADIAIYSMSIDTPVKNGPRVYAPDSGDVRHHNPVFDQLEQLFARLFKSGQYPSETEDYRELIRRGGSIVSADVSETQVDLVRDLMRRTGATDIEERAKMWRNGSAASSISEPDLHRGSSTTHDDSSHYAPSSTRQADAFADSRPIAGTTPSSAKTETTAYNTNPRDIPSVLDASRAPVSEQSTAGIARTQGTDFSSGGLKMASGMQQVTTRTEKPASTISGENQQASSAGFAGDPITANPLIDDPYDDQFREDYDAHYASSGASYDEYQRAYSHGATLGQDERYRGHDWQRVEANARENWESQYPESGWERFKAAVRHGWDRVTGG